VLARLVGALGLLDVLLSVGGQSFVAPFFTAPQGQCCVFSLEVAVGQVGGHKRKYAAMMAAMMQSSSRAGVQVSALSLPSRRPVLSLGGLCSRLDFRGMDHGAHLGPTEKKTV
jgi:hypothetical protein